MRIPRLFVELTLDADATLVLPDAQSHYLRNVLRCRVGDAVYLFNGKGGAYLGEVITLDRHDAEIRLTQFEPGDRESPLVTHIGLAVTRRDAMDTAIQKATELGANEITPLVTEFTSVPEKALAKRSAHWLQISRSACEQCERNRPPTLNDIVSLETWLRDTSAALKLVAHPYESVPLSQLEQTPDSIALLIGPEGGLSDTEVTLAQQYGYIAVGLGPRILRADTVPAALLALVQARWGDLR